MNGALTRWIEQRALWLDSGGSHLDKVVEYLQGQAFFERQDAFQVACYTALWFRIVRTHGMVGLGLSRRHGGHGFAGTSLLPVSAKRLTSSPLSIST